MSEYLTVENEKVLRVLVNHEENEIAYCEAEDKYMIYQNNDWVPWEPHVDENSGIQMNLYEINKQLISQFPPLTKEQLKEKAIELTDWCNTELYLLYGQEMNYFTLFCDKINFPHHRSEFKTIGEGIIDILSELAEKIYSIEMTEARNAYEIWIQYEDITTVLYLFDYTQGVVIYG